VLSAVLQVVIFPLPDFYFLGWIAFAPLLVALFRTRDAAALQLSENAKLQPASPIQAFLLSYASGVLWYLGTCYWIYSTMRQYGGVNVPSALGMMLLFSLYVALYHGLFGLLVGLLARRSQRLALVMTPVLWVASELARTRVTGFPWNLLGTTQVDNVPLARIASWTGVYGLSLEILVVNVAFAAAFLVPREKRKTLLLASVMAAVVLQSGRWIPAPATPSDRTATLVQQNIPILQGADWTKDYFDGTLRDVSWISLNAASSMQGLRLIIWPESPAPFYSNDPTFRTALSNVAQQGNVWLLAGGLGQRTPSHMQELDSRIYNSGILVNPAGQMVARYDKVHLVPFGEYVPFRRLFSFAAGLTENVGDFTPGTSREPLQAGDAKLGVFICYESVFPDDIRKFAANGSQVFVNISNDGWYGDSGAYAQHLKQVRMRAMENSRWVLRATNTGVTASIDPYGRIVTSIPRKLRTAMQAPYALTQVTTFYTRHGDWFAYLCAIISVAAVLWAFLLRPGTKA
jgi:apolipoprotein N-acyltransferase